MNCCEILANSISSSNLRELDLGNNKLTDAGITKICDGLKESKIEKLRSVSNKRPPGIFFKQVVPAGFFYCLLVQTAELQPNRALLEGPGLNYQLCLLQTESSGPL